MGAHPLAPSRVAHSGQALAELIDGSPEAQLGARVVEQFGPRLPFLLKVLAAASPLSLQAHPSQSQARAGFDADEAAGIPLDAPHRNYKDRNHKPELLCALGEFWALCGFREVAKTLALLDELAVPELEPYRGLLAEKPNQAGISSTFSGLMSEPAPRRSWLAQRTAQACRARLAQSSAFAHELDWALRIAELYPNDVGVVIALLLNLLRLDAGEAVYLPAGNLHAYLGGTGVEIMASSDNVLRGGLTPKHVNVPELLRVLDFRPLTLEPLRPVLRGKEHVFVTPASEFELSFFDLEPAATSASVAGPEIWLLISGHASLHSASQSLALTPGRSAFVSADTGQLELSGSGRIFRAKVAQSA
jgi:mannose-6-phosphate isomerase